jgi:hypothetical protein
MATLKLEKVEYSPASRGVTSGTPRTATVHFSIYGGDSERNIGEIKIFYEITNFQNLDDAIQKAQQKLAEFA